MRTADYTEIPKLSRIFRLFERRSRSDCVHKQVAKLGPVSRAAGMDCECPLADKHSPASNARSIKRRVKGGCILFLCHPLPKRSGSICCWRAGFSSASIEILRQNPSHSRCISSSRSEKDVSGLTSLTRTHGLCLRCSRQRSCARS